MSGYVTTHVLDMARGRPAAGMAVVLFRLEGGARVELSRMVTDGDGRTAGPILAAADFAPGHYELEFHAGAWMDATMDGAMDATMDGAGVAAGGLRFLDVIPIRFGLSEAAHYHVPLLLSPFGYSTYRGS